MEQEERSSKILQKKFGSTKIQHARKYQASKEYSTCNQKHIASENLGPHQIQRIRKESGTEQYRTPKNYKLFAVQVSKCAGALACIAGQNSGTSGLCVHCASLVLSTAGYKAVTGIVQLQKYTGSGNGTGTSAFNNTVICTADLGKRAQYWVGTS